MIGDGDLDMLFADFAQTATLTGPDSETYSVAVLFDNSYHGARLYDGTVESTAPAALCKTSDLAVVDDRGVWRLTISGTEYAIINLQPDGQGLTQAILTTDF